MAEWTQHVDDLSVYDDEEGRLGYGWPGNPMGVRGHGALFPSCWATWRLRRFWTVPMTGKKRL